MSDRNLNPHAEARVAMALWSDRYSKQKLGCMDFYDGLTAAQKQTCAQIVDGIIYADRADGRTPAPADNVVAWKPVEYDHEVTLQASREASSNVDDADPRRVLLAVLGCAETWTPTARIIGNVRAGDISIALRAALASTEGREG